MFKLGFVTAFVDTSVTFPFSVTKLMTRSESLILILILSSPNNLSNGFGISCDSKSASIVPSSASKLAAEIEVDNSNRIVNNVKYFFIVLPPDRY